MSCFSAETTVGANVGGPKIGRSPRTQESRTSARKSRREGTKNSESLYSRITLHVPLRPLL
jgi:hypothetical protein